MAGSDVLGPPPRGGLSDFIARHGNFGAQVMFSLIGALLMCLMLWKGEDAAKYLPVLTAIIGYWVPSPSTGAVKPTPNAAAAAAAAAAASNKDPAANPAPASSPPMPR